jgi:hypothetical protein
MSKFHQLSSGGIISDDGEFIVLSDFKISQFLEGKPSTNRYAFFYLFRAEEHIVKSRLDSVTSDISKFKSGESQHFISHFKSGAEGITLSECDSIVMLNVPHSYKLYEQSRNRGILKETSKSEVIWIMSDFGLEKQIYDVVQAKKDFTTRHYRKLLKASQ